MRNDKIKYSRWPWDKVGHQGFFMASGTTKVIIMEHKFTHHFGTPYSV